MAAVVAFLNSKGGPGKTTLATEIAGCLHRWGHTVLIVDPDLQGSARDWCEAHPEGADLPPVVGVDLPFVHLTALSLGNTYDYVVINGAAKMEMVTASAIKAADFQGPAPRGGGKARGGLRGVLSNRKVSSGTVDRRGVGGVRAAGTAGPNDAPRGLFCTANARLRRASRAVSMWQ